MSTTQATDTMTADIATVRQAIINRIARRAKINAGMSGVTVAAVWNWWEIDGIGAVAVERAIRGLIADELVDETRYYGALAFDTLML